jgi:hypothetical protein
MIAAVHWVMTSARKFFAKEDEWPMIRCPLTPRISSLKDTKPHMKPLSMTFLYVWLKVKLA